LGFGRLNFNPQTQTQNPNYQLSNKKKQKHGLKPKSYKVRLPSLRSQGIVFLLINNRERLYLDQGIFLDKEMEINEL
jgi:hypothetical protein